MQSHQLLSSVRRLSPLVIPMSTMSPTETKGVQLQVVPQSCLQDEPVKIHVHGLRPGQTVTLQTRLKDVRKTEFMAHAHYRASALGEVDVMTMESEGGRYTGHFPMGLIAGMAPAPHVYKFSRYFKRDVENANQIEVRVFDGHLTAEELYAETREEPLTSIIHERHYMAPGVQRIPVRYGKVRATLFLPPGDGPFPGVIDMFGTAGGLLEYRSAQLASRGFASLALAFFAFEDLPKTLDEFNIEYFEEAVDFLLKHEKVMKSGVGSIGVSKGGDLVLSMATFIPMVKAAVWINGCNANVQSDFRIHGSIIPGLKFELDRLKVLEDGSLDASEAMDNPADFPDTIIPIEKANAEFLFLVGLDDKNWKSEMYADMAAERLKKAEKNNYEVLKYRGTGHLLEPPFSPVCAACYHKTAGVPLLFGGRLEGHTQAQIHAWPRVMQFLFRVLRK